MESTEKFCSDNKMNAENSYRQTIYSFESHTLKIWQRNCVAKGITKTLKGSGYRRCVKDEVYVNSIISEQAPVIVKIFTEIDKPIRENVKGSALYSISRAL